MYNACGFTIFVAVRRCLFFWTHPASFLKGPYSGHVFLDVLCSAQVSNDLSLKTNVYVLCNRYFHSWRWQVLHKVLGTWLVQSDPYANMAVKATITRLWYNVACSNMVRRKYIDTYMCVHTSVHIALQLGAECSTSTYLCCLQASLPVCLASRDAYGSNATSGTVLYRTHKWPRSMLSKAYLFVSCIYEIVFAEVPSDLDFWVWDMSSSTVDSSRRPPPTKFILAILIERLWWPCAGQQIDGFPC